MKILRAFASTFVGFLAGVIVHIAYTATDSTAQGNWTIFAAGLIILAFFMSLTVDC